jgi:hypothetical protein
MRIRLTSGLLTPLAVAGAVLCTLPSSARAWDEDRVQSEIQPYFGAWAGMYMVNHQDLDDLVSNNNGQLSSSFFSGQRPALGGSLGVAYGRMHVGLNGGYQMIDGDYLPANVANASNSTMLSTYYYRYQVIPLDINIDVALLPNKTPVNLLVGGSVGVGLVGMQLPIYALANEVDSTHTRVSYYHNDWNWNNYLLATIYAGARINLARRLNLEAQIGWRFLKSDEVDLSHGYVLQQTFQKTVDSTGKTTSRTLANIPIDLSAPYVRADIRWTFSSQQERDDAATAERVRRMHDLLAMTPRYVAEHQD